MLKHILLVGLGGGIGSILRFLTSVVTQKYNSTLFPLATFAVNILGCFLIGLLIGLLGTSIQNNQNLRFLLITGFCGGYTTFSTFASENFNLLQNHSYGMAALYIGTSIVGGLIAVWLGLTITK
ncbi:fluoride efflux transporter CrcB [Albibacterium indicum]|uniref:fluoride efflux transporter CrcB n=1 Tax=Albibacterium indicum TaxID=2292082 RepID=UPI000E505721|nr:fluoride efflux transporter CrcB [Pedobacter indicus]